MVMHARKTQRMNDGYFEKHQAHPYQNSKYGSSKNYGSTSDRYDRIRESPNGNYRSDSPDSPRDRERSYQSKGSYLQKIREKERENRDYKMSRDKFSDCARSPKDKRSRESEHRTNNDRNEEKSILHPIKMVQNQSSRDRKPVHNNSVDKRDDRERVPRVGDWSEHVSSSGKKYYYNCKTEVSQWEKPREWERFRGRDRDRDRDSDRSYSRSGARHEKHSSNSRSTNSGSGGSKDASNRGGDTSSAMGGSSRHWSSSSSRDDSDAPSKSGGGNANRKQEHSQATSLYTATSGGQDMDISPGDSTPTSELSYSTGGALTHTSSSSIHHHHHPHHHHHANTSSAATSSTSSAAACSSTISSDQQQQSMLGPVLLANALPRLMSHHHVITASTSTSSSTAAPSTQHRADLHRADMSPQCTTTPTAGSSAVMMPNAGLGPGPPQQSNRGGAASTLAPSGDAALSVAMATTSLALSDKGLHGAAAAAATVLGLLHQRSAAAESGHAGSSNLSVDTNNGTTGEGPPTPTHSETPDCNKAVAVPVSSPSGNLSTLQGMSSSLQALRPQGPSITPSLANHYRDDLVNHVRGWPAEILEKQAQKLADEAHIMGSIQCSKVSAELKSARSIVRLTEIQATLQEQRILFLRQQIKELEELKSQNSFMSDDS